MAETTYRVLTLVAFIGSLAGLVLTIQGRYTASGVTWNAVAVLLWLGRLLPDAAR